MPVKLTIITPVFNNEKFIAETIESVIFQKGDFSIEYIIVDNCSTDSTIDIANKYQNLIKNNPWLVKCNNVDMKIITEPDDGMYDAINKGFTKATGNVFAYINSDDVYLQGAFSLVSSLFEKYQDIEWLKGRTSYINEKSIVYQKGTTNLYFTDWIKKGVYGNELYFIQQDSVFWRAGLWNQIGTIEPKLKLAGDFYLWINFAKYADLYSVDADLSCFRRADNQLSQDMKKYYLEVSTIDYLKLSKFEKIKLNLYNLINRFFRWKFFSKIIFVLFFPQHKYQYIELNKNDFNIVKQKSPIKEN